MLIADKATRTLTADPLLPFGEQGRTNLGRVTAAKGRLTIPADTSNLVLNLQHDPNAPVAKFTSVTETPKGLRATFQVPATRAGDDLLAEVDAGLRTGVSVEIDEPVIRDGQLLGGTLSGAAAVVAPAFPSAQLVAADAGDLPNPTDPTEADPAEDEAAAAAVQEDDAMGATTTEAAAEATETEPTEALAAALPGSLNGKTKTKAKAPTLFAALAATEPAERGKLLAALDALIPTDVLPSQQQTWIGEVYGSKTYMRRFAGLMQHGDLNGMQYIGWKFTDGKTPVVAPYNGYPAQPNSNEVKTEQVTGSAARLAGAGEVDRAFIDFPTPEFWAGYFREQTNSYERVIDGIARDALISGGTPVVAGAIPASVATAAAYIVDGAIAILDNERDLPSWALVGSALYRELLLTRADDTLAYLSAALGVDKGDLAGFRIVPTSVASLVGKVLVGTGTASTLYELPGVPVRVDTVNIANGGAQRGVFGYHAELINDAKGLALVAAAG